MYGTQRGIAAYRQTEVQSRTPLELVVMLYDGALRFMREAKAAGEANDIRRRNTAISRAQAIVSELQNTLDMNKGGDIAASLDQLYGFVRDRLVEAMVPRNATTLDAAITVMTNLRDGWAEISARESRAVAR